MLVYKKQWCDERTGEIHEKPITYGEALDLVLHCYRDCDMTRDMLTIVNCIKLRGYTYIAVKSDDGMVLMAGLCNMLPMDTAYDDDGNRVEG